MLKSKDIQPVFVRVKRRRDLNTETGDRELAKYIENLAGYLEEQGAVFVDYTRNNRIQVQHYGAGDHLNRGEGRTLFTRMVAESLLSIN